MGSEVCKHLNFDVDYNHPSSLGVYSIKRKCKDCLYCWQSFKKPLKAHDYVPGWGVGEVEKQAEIHLNSIIVNLWEDETKNGKESNEKQEEQA